MKNQSFKKKLCVLALIFVMLLTFCGCTKTNINIKVKKGGVVDFDIKLLTLASAGTTLLDEEDVELFKSNGWQISEYTGNKKLAGYIIKKSDVNIDDFTTSDDNVVDSVADIAEGRLFSKNENGNYVLTVDTNLANYTDTYTAEEVGLLSDYAEEIESSSIGECFLILTLQSASVSNNATTVSDDGKELKWELEKLPEGEMATVEFEVPKTSYLPLILGILGGLVIIGLIVWAILDKKYGKPKEPKFHIVKRSNTTIAYGISVRAIAIVAAIIVSAILLVVVTKKNPLDVFAQFFSGALGAKRVWGTIQEVAILLGIALALTPAFRMHFWNTGAEGQTLAGCLATAVVMFTLGGKIPEWLLIILMFAAAILTGVIWGVIPAFCKAQWGTNETLFTLMMNYVAIQLVEFFLKIGDPSGSNVVGPEILSHGWFRLPESWFAGMGDNMRLGSAYFLNILLVAALTALVSIYINKTKHGYEISVVGESERTAKYIGINVKNVIIRTMALSGGICGFIGCLLVGGTSHNIESNLVQGRGFTAIMVAWLAKFNPIMMILTTLLIVFLSRGASSVATYVGINSSFSDIITSIIIFFIIGCEFFINYKIVRTHKIEEIDKSKEGKK